MANPCILVAGGAGYIGSHFCKKAAEAGFAPLVLDRLTAASPRVEAFRREAVKAFPLEVADFGDAGTVSNIIEKYRPVAAVCFAALIEAAESVARPDLYMENNFSKAARFFEALKKGGVNKLVFSSTAAVYGAPRHDKPLVESDAAEPINPYGASKLAAENALRKDFASLNSIIFRYFNAAGAAGTLGEMHEPETHLIPTALFAANKGKTLTIYGTDYPTPDGSCVRDYVHVEDLAEAHIASLRTLLNGGTSDVFNLGTGKGYSVREVVDAVRSITGKDFPVREGPRRAGDPPFLVANAAKAQEMLKWKPKRGLEEMVASAYAFHAKQE